MDREHLETTIWPFLENHYGLPSGLLNAIATVETGGTYNPRAYNAQSGAAGLFQLTQITLEQLRLDTGIRFDPLIPGPASTAAALLLRKHLQTFGGQLTLALAAYNAGQGTVRKFLKDVQSIGRGKLPRETVRYIPRVIAEMP